MDRLSKRKKALENYEKQKRKESEKTADANYTKLEMTKMCTEKRKEDSLNLQRQIR